jgi:FkbM family methyltransferase
MNANLQVTPIDAGVPRTRLGSARALVREGLKPLLPASLYWRLLAWRVGYFDPELRLLPKLCDPHRWSVDIGASIGSYTVHLLRHSKGCIIFEPRPEALAHIVKRLSPRPDPRLRIEPVALSDHDGEAALRVVTSDAGRSTIEPANVIADGAATESLIVPVRRLDDYMEIIEPIGFIKIDVEGHEEAVLRGASGLLVRDRPSLLVEIEERHKPGCVDAIRQQLRELGYRGFFLRRGRLRPIELFTPERHQQVARIGERINGEPVYVNNFLFLPPIALPPLEHLIDRR